MSDEAENYEPTLIVVHTLSKFKAFIDSCNLEYICRYLNSGTVTQLWRHKASKKFFKLSSPQKKGYVWGELRQEYPLQEIPYLDAAIIMIHSRKPMNKIPKELKQTIKENII